MATATVTIPDLDRAIGFTIPSRHARGRMVRLGPVLDEVLAAHAYPPPIERLLAEALTLTALIGSTLKDAGGQLTLQAQTQGGIVSLMVCDYRGGALRGYVQFDAERLAQLGKAPSIRALFGPQSHLAITFDQASTNERYQGIVPLDGATLAEVAEGYFVQSEQIPTLIRLGLGTRGEAHVAGGLLVQHLPEGEEGRERLHVRLDHPEWEPVAALAGTMGADELAAPAIPLEELVWRLFNEEDEVRILAGLPLHRGCRCDADYIASVLEKFTPEQRAEMAEDDGFIHVDCAFCAKSFPLAA